MSTGRSSSASPSALGRVGLDAAPGCAAGRRLSGGQGTRARLAALTFAEPDFLLLDEPTNNLDRDGREAVIDLLAGWRHGAIVVSHDRELLETMDAIVELTVAGRARRYGGNWSQYRARKAIELSAAEARPRGCREARVPRSIARRRKRPSGRRARTARAQSSAPRATCRALPPACARIAAKTRGGENARLAERRRTQALEALPPHARQRIEVLQPFSVQLPSTRSAGRAG